MPLSWQPHDMINTFSDALYNIFAGFFFKRLEGSVYSRAAFNIYLEGNSRVVHIFTVYIPNYLHACVHMAMHACLHA